MPRTPFSQAQDNPFKIEVIKRALRRSPLFERLDDTTLEAVLSACVSKRLEKGETLFREGEPSIGFYLVQSGSICLNRVSREGKEQVISIIQPNQSFAEASLGALERSPVNAFALESTQVILIRKDRFREIIKSKPELALNIIASMSLHLKNNVQMIEDLKFKSVECRLANWLSRNAVASDSNNQATVDLPMSKKLLASRLGVASETLSRALARFRNEKIISVEGRHIAILDVTALHRYLEE